MVYCSTNKVYGDNVNSIKVKEKETRYEFTDKNSRNGITETFSTDLCEHTPYGASKFAADVYVQDYARRNEIDAAVFRMSCIYGTRQFGVEDQGWVSWFTIATLLGKPITIYGDGKQVRDMLYVTDLVAAFDAFIQERSKIHHGVYNMGGGTANTMSLIELLGYLEEITGKKELGWKPGVNPRDGVRNFNQHSKVMKKVKYHNNLLVQCLNLIS